MSFLRDRAFGRIRESRHAPLGPLEIEIMGILWAAGECSVRDVVPRLSRPLAYTTVMTTLDRLYKKGLLERRKSERAFLYSPCLGRCDWERQWAGDVVQGFLRAASPARESLLSFLIEAVGQQDEALLEDLERKIRLKRKELVRRSQP